MLLHKKTKDVTDDVFRGYHKKVCHCYLKIKHVKMIKAILVTCNIKPGKLKKNRLENEINQKKSTKVTTTYDNTSSIRETNFAEIATSTAG